MTEVTHVGSEIGTGGDLTRVSGGDQKCLKIDVKQVDQQTVSQSIGAAYGKAGYQVVQGSDPASDIKTITVHVVEFWSWMSPGAFSVAVNNKSHLKVDTGVPSPVEVKTLKREGMQMITEDDWKLITEAGLQAITDSMAKQL
ncbi:hypothetical protein [Pseudomonas chlororaphis]|uniref:hypothetical protein n=1 Tax=Pseudomonas chlororaphis TaxID=587753 RepID=UPI000AFA1C0E|nr:hypothetical protein [Pseudomonas chlororaphis]